MTLQAAGEVIVYGSTGFVLVACLLMLVALLGIHALHGLNPRYLHPTPSGFILRRPWEQNALLRLTTFFSLLLPLLLVIVLNLRSYGALPPYHWPFLWGMTGGGLTGAILLLWAGKPQELALDENRHTYCHTYGWPPFRRQRTGPWSDLAGIWVQEGSHVVYVRWEDETSELEVGRFRSSEKAERYADELVSKLGMPCRATPSSTELVRRPFKIAAILFFPGVIVFWLVDKFVLNRPDTLDWMRLYVLSIGLLVGYVTFKKIMGQTRK